MSLLSASEKIRAGQRRSKRLNLQVPVLVYGHNADNKPFHEASRMLTLNLHGGLLALGAHVELDQFILLLNRTTQEEQECRVASIGPFHGGKRRVGIEFRRASPNFWRIDFPPPDLKGLVR